MSKFKVIMSWVGIILLGLAHGLLEDIMFIRVLVEYIPASWDLTGDIFFIFTVPLAQLMTFAITGTLAWRFLWFAPFAKTRNVLGLLDLCPKRLSDICAKSDWRHCHLFGLDYIVVFFSRSIRAKAVKAWRRSGLTNSRARCKMKGPEDFIRNRRYDSNG